MKGWGYLSVVQNLLLKITNTRLFQKLLPCGENIGLHANLLLLEKSMLTDKNRSWRFDFDQTFELQKRCESSKTTVVFRILNRSRREQRIFSKLQRNIDNKIKAISVQNLESSQFRLQQLSVTVFPEMRILMKSWSSEEKALQAQSSKKPFLNDRRGQCVWKKGLYFETVSYGSLSWSLTVHLTTLRKSHGCTTDWKGFYKEEGGIINKHTTFRT